MFNIKLLFISATIVAAHVTSPLPTTLFRSPRDVTVTVVVTTIPTSHGPDFHLAGCEREVEVGWTDFFITKRTINFCYPKLKHTCQRDAKAAYCKWKDFCETWNATMTAEPPAECFHENNKPLHVCKGCNRDNPEFREPNPSRCCPQPGFGMGWEDYHDDDLLCRRYRTRNEDEWDFYTQNFPWYGVTDEDFSHNLTIEEYRETGERKNVD